MDGDGFISEADLILKIERLIFKMPLFTAEEIPVKARTIKIYQDTISSQVIPVPEVHEADLESEPRKEPSEVKFESEAIQSRGSE